ncbi:hypothetical protein [Okeania sp. SIO1I7]|uniref:hypothetical protein n=1 Tax=Okeania sp. SIO1I7 TaxID=2607772 RepID=UPI0013FABACE|nr:hypothetical protein [Okeania sp. SIO1I7]NET30230.1 hypothetical protein [Okeania sp. SIO1I7]
METGEFDQQLKRLDLLLDKCTQKYQEGMKLTDELLSKLDKSKPQKTEKSNGTGGLIVFNFKGNKKAKMPNSNYGTITPNNYGYTDLRGIFSDDNDLFLEIIFNGGVVTDEQLEKITAKANERVEIAEKVVEAGEKIISLSDANTKIVNAHSKVFGRIGTNNQKRFDSVARQYTTMDKTQAGYDLTTERRNDKYSAIRATLDSALANLRATAKTRKQQLDIKHEKLEKQLEKQLRKSKRSPRRNRKKATV